MAAPRDRTRESEWNRNMKKLNEYETPETDKACGFYDLDTAVDANFARDLERRLLMCRDALMETSHFWQAVIMHFGPVHAAKQAEKEALAIRDETLKATQK